MSVWVSELDGHVRIANARQVQEGYEMSIFHSIFVLNPLWANNCNLLFQWDSLYWFRQPDSQTVMWWYVAFDVLFHYVYETNYMYET